MEFTNKQCDSGSRTGDDGLRAPAVLAWLRLARVFQKVERTAAEQMRARDLSMAQFDVLAQVGAAEGLTQQQLADRLLVTKGNVTQLLSRMEADGLIRRCQEGRANAVFLTAKGRAIRETALPAQQALIARQFAALDGAEQSQLLAL